MEKIKPFRYWYYFRLGFTTYAGIIFAAVNTAVVTYYLAINDVPILKGSILPIKCNYNFRITENDRLTFTTQYAPEGSIATIEPKNPLTLGN